MKFAKLTASTAALLLSSTALMAQEASSQSMQSVFIDVGGTAVLVPMDVALEACSLDESTLQTTVQARIDESGIDQTQLMAQMDSAMGMMGGATGDAATQDTAAAGATGTDATAGSDTTQTADANATTDAGNATTDMGNTTDTATADASGAAAGDASGAATGTETTDTATADASGAAGQDATATGTDATTETADAGAAATTEGTVENVESTAADTSGAAAGTAGSDPFIALAACQIDATRAAELQIDTTMTGSSMGFDATTLGLQTQ